MDGMCRDGWSVLLVPGDLLEVLTPNNTKQTNDCGLANGFTLRKLKHLLLSAEEERRRLGRFAFVKVCCFVKQKKNR